MLGLHLLSSACSLTRPSNVQATPELFEFLANQAGQADRTSEYYDCPLRLLGSADDDSWRPIGLVHRVEPCKYEIQSD